MNNIKPKISKKLQTILSYSNEEVFRLGDNCLKIEHIFLGILRDSNNIATYMLSNFFKLKATKLKTLIETSLSSNQNESKSRKLNDSPQSLSPQTERVFKLMYLESLQLDNENVGPEHALLAILKDASSLTAKMLLDKGVNYSLFKKYLAHVAQDEDGSTFKTITSVSTKNTMSIISNGYLVEYDNIEGLNPEDLLLPEIELVDSNDNNSTDDNTDYDNDNDNDNDNDITDGIQINDSEDNFSDNNTLPYDSDNKANPLKTKSKLTIEIFGKDLTLAATKGLLDPIVGREKEIERIAQILSRRKKNNPILIGEPGVGKSAIAEGLAIKIIEKKVPYVLLDKRIMSLDITSIVAGTKYRGQFEERMKVILEELIRHPEIIIFIDEIHTLVGAGDSTGSLDASNMLKPALARGELQCIGATTLDEYRRSIEKDGAMERRFQKVIIDPTSEKETLEILHHIKNKYEEHHSVKYTDESLKACVEFTSRYVTDRFLPDKAIDALDEAGAKVHIKNIDFPHDLLELESKLIPIQEDIRLLLKDMKFEEASNKRKQLEALQSQIKTTKEEWENKIRSNRPEVNEQDIAEVVSMISGIPLQKVEQNEIDKLMDMEEFLQKQIIGQNEAIEKIVLSIRRNRIGLKDPNKPIGSFIFLGPTGVGKTYLTKILAKHLFDSESSMIRIDMSEYMEKFAVSRLIGAPPGYVGYEDGGQLTEKVRHKPYSIILFDEIEKAHPDIFNLLLQVLDEGQLTDGVGRKVDFKNTVIIMTSNLGSRQIKDFGQGVGFYTASRASEKDTFAKGVIDKALNKQFSPEFLNRIDEIIIFHNLIKEDILKIVDIELSYLHKRLSKMGLSLSISDNAKDFLIEKGWNPDLGARPMKRAIQKYIEDPLAEELIKRGIKAGHSLSLDYDKEQDKILVNMEK